MCVTFAPPPTGQPTSACVNGFITQDLTTVLESSNSLIVRHRQQSVIPSIRFSCSGSITAWTIGTRWRGNEDRRYFPHLQIWRSNGDGFTYILVGDTELFVPGGDERPNGNYIFSGTPDPPLQFEAGDILGIFQPRASRSRVRLYYEASTGPVNYYINTDNANEPQLTVFATTDADEMENRLPLLSVEIGMLLLYVTIK